MRAYPRKSAGSTARFWIQRRSDALAALQALKEDGPRDLPCANPAMGIRALCAPSMGADQKGFKSPV